MVYRLGRVRLGAIVLLGSIACALLIASQVFAGGTATLSVGSDEIAPGDSTTVEVVAEAAELGAWTVDVVVANPDQVTIVGCDAPSHSVCNPEYNATTVRFAGAVATGLSGEISIGTVTVECADTEGSSLLNLDTVGFADATVGGPVEIPVTFSPGTIDCSEDAVRPTATDGPDGGDGDGDSTPTATVAGAGGFPSTGYGSGGHSNTLYSLIAAVAVTGAVALVSSLLAIKRSRS